MVKIEEKIYEDRGEQAIDFFFEEAPDGGETQVVSMACDPHGNWSIRQSGVLREDLETLDDAREEWRDVPLYLTEESFKDGSSVKFSDILAALLRRAGKPGDWSGQR